jgi:hypothetical protein
MMARLDDDIFATLRRKFISNVAPRLEAMDDTLGRLSSLALGSEDSLDILKSELHKLRGSGVSFGYPEISAWPARRKITWADQEVTVRCSAR